MMLPMIYPLLLMPGCKCTLTDNATIKFHSHGDPAVPRDWMNPEKACCYGSRQFVTNDNVPIVITLEYLKDIRVN